MAKAKAPAKSASPWLKVRCGVNQLLLVAPAEQALVWGGSQPTGRVALYMMYWKDVVDELPPHLRPSGSGGTPKLVVADEAAADAATAELRAWVKARHPEMKVKKQKELTRFLCAGDQTYWITRANETAIHLVFDNLAHEELETVEVDGGSVLLWRITEHPTVRVRATPDEIVFVDTRTDTAALDPAVSGKATPQGTWTCSKLLVAMWAPQAITDLTDIDKRSLAALAPFAGKVLEAKNRDPIGGGAILPVAGTFRAETGGGKGIRWLRFVRT
jgi:hypothetical protein